MKEKLAALSIADLRLLQRIVDGRLGTPREMYYWEKAHEQIEAELNSRITDIFGPIK